ncbi:hypothetical protein HBB16_01890 [Pseudonocardia sp. MCCB 268]|nr:hypothetical protein [Pseudonocardia cytotoxica]
MSGAASAATAPRGRWPSRRRCTWPSERWRNLPKPTIAAVQGKVVAGGLMLLVWPCDLIVAAEDASFADNTASMGVPEREFFNHPFEVGAGRPREMLFT